MDEYRKQITTKWGELKAQIKSRPFLAYLVGIPIEKYRDYIIATPSNEEVLRIEKLIHKDRIEKTLRIREGLQKITGYRETVKVAKKLGISDTTLRQIMTGKREASSYQSIDRIELFLQAVSDFEPSLENSLSVFDFLTDEISDINKSFYDIAEGLKNCQMDLNYMAKNKKLPFLYKGSFDSIRYNPTDRLVRYSVHLNETIEKLSDLIDTYIEKSTEN
jgi:transcriptional regulator with XRE-family HTH domain